MSDPTPLIPYEWPGTYYFGEEEYAAVKELLDSRSLFRFYGPDMQYYARRLEQAFAARLGRKYALAVGSGTAALGIAMGAIGVGPGDEVLLPGYLWVSCLAAIVRAGAIPRLVDIDDTFCMDPEDLKRKIGPHSRAVLLVHMSGAPGAVDKIAAICRENQLLLVEDCAQANGSSLNGKPVGSFGDMAIFSFQLNKNMTAGEGGMVVCDELKLNRRAWAFHDLGYPRTDEGRLDTSDPEFHFWGQGARCPELMAAVLYAQHQKLGRITGDMRRAKWSLRAKLEGIPGLKFRRILDPAGDSGPFLIMTWKDRDTCLRMVEETRAAGVTTGPLGTNNIPMTNWGMHMYYNNGSLVGKTSNSASGRPWNDPLNAFAADYSYAKGTLPVLDDLVSRSSMLSIPPVLGEDAIVKIAAAFRAAAGV